LTKNKTTHVYTIDLLDDGQLNVFIKVYEPTEDRKFYERLHVYAFEFFKILDESGTDNEELKKILEKIKQS